MAALDPDQEAALRRLRAGFVVVLRIVDHDQDQDNDESLDGEQAPPAGR